MEKTINLNDVFIGPKPKNKHKELVLLQDKILIDKARKDFKTYINLVFKTKLHTESTRNTFNFNWLNEIIIEELSDFIVNPEVNNIMIFAPPRVGKSTISSMLLPSYLFGKFSQGILKHGGPKFEVMSGSYQESLASVACRETQNYMDSPVYKAIFPQVTLPKMGGYIYNKRFRRSSLYFDVVGDLTTGALESKHCFKTLPDGSPPPVRDTASYRVIYPGGTVTGLGYSLGILDDMVKTHKDVDSKVARDNIYNWYISTFGTRQQKFNNMNAKTIILMTRWHHDDLPGRLLRLDEESKEDKRLWRVVCLPAEGYPKKDKYRHPKDPRKAGEVKTIRNMDKTYFKQKKIEVGSFYPALFQQKPTSDVGEYIKRKWIHYYDQEEHPDQNFNMIIGGGDLSFDAVEGGSYNVFLRCGVNFVEVGNLQQAHVFVIDCFRERMEYAEMKMALRQFIGKYKNWSGAFLIELAANAYAIKSELGPSHKRLKSRDAHESLSTEIPFLEVVTVRDSKPVRVMSNIGVIQYGKLFVPKPETAEWIEPFIEELVGWPKASNDDCVDALMVVLAKVNKQISNVSSLKLMSKMF